MALILAGGLYAVYRERAREVAVITNVPMPASASMVQQNEIQQSETGPNADLPVETKTR
jgi:hypothetical protein